MVSNSSENGKRISFSFTLRAEVGDPYGSIIQYYQQLPKEVSRTLILEAASVYWGLVAQEHWSSRAGEPSPGRKLITDHIYQLRAYGDELITEFGIGESVTLCAFENEGITEPLSFEFYYQVYDAHQFP